MLVFKMVIYDNNNNGRYQDNATWSKHPQTWLSCCEPNRLLRLGNRQSGSKITIDTGNEQLRPATEHNNLVRCQKLLGTLAQHLLWLIATTETTRVAWICQFCLPVMADRCKTCYKTGKTEYKTDNINNWIQVVFFGISELCQQKLNTFPHWNAQDSSGNTWHQRGHRDPRQRQSSHGRSSAVVAHLGGFC